MNENVTEDQKTVEQVLLEKTGIAMCKSFKLIPEIDGYEFGIITEGFKLKLYKDNFSMNRFADNDTLMKILLGIQKIEMLPFKPNLGEDYYTIIENTRGELVVKEQIFENKFHNLKAMALGLCFSTKLEANCARYKMYEKIRKMAGVD